MPRPIENDAGLTAPQPEARGVPERSESGIWGFGDLFGGLSTLRCGRWPARRVRAFSLFRSFLYDPGPGY